MVSRRPKDKRSYGETIERGRELVHLCEGIHGESDPQYMSQHLLSRFSFHTSGLITTEAFSSVQYLLQHAYWLPML